MNNPTRTTIRAISEKLKEIAEEIRELRESEHEKILRLSPGLLNSPTGLKLFEAKLNLMVVVTDLHEAIHYLELVCK